MQRSIIPECIVKSNERACFVAWKTIIVMRRLSISVQCSPREGLHAAEHHDVTTLFFQKCSDIENSAARLQPKIT